MLSRYCVYVNVPNWENCSILAFFDHEASMDRRV
jgi:hypothetical protein